MDLAIEESPLEGVFIQRRPMGAFRGYHGSTPITRSRSLSLGLALSASMIIWVHRSFADAFDEGGRFEAPPNQLLRLFDVEPMTSLEAFLAVESSVVGWVLLRGRDVGFSATRLIVDDVDRGRLDTFL